MTKATPGQLKKIKKLIKDKGTSFQQTEALLGGPLADMFDPRVRLPIDRGALREVLGLTVEYILDADALPEIPDGLFLTGPKTQHMGMGAKVKFEKRKGKLYANGCEVVSRLTPIQRKRGSISGHEILAALKQDGATFLNATVGFYLRENAELIPTQWKRGRTYLWGTIFRSISGEQYVLYLAWDDVAGWYLDRTVLAAAFHSEDYAGCLAQAA